MRRASPRLLSSVLLVLVEVIANLPLPPSVVAARSCQWPGRSARAVLAGDLFRVCCVSRRAWLRWLRNRLEVICSW